MLFGIFAKWAKTGPGQSDISSGPLRFFTRSAPDIWVAEEKNEAANEGSSQSLCPRPFGRHGYARVTCGLKSRRSNHAEQSVRNEQIFRWTEGCRVKNSLREFVLTFLSTEVAHFLIFLSPLPLLNAPLRRRSVGGSLSGDVAVLAASLFFLSANPLLFTAPLLARAVRATQSVLPK